MAHTPGPWIDRDGVIGPEDDAGGMAWIADTRTCVNERANARLIAAAPDLYAALKTLIDALPSDEYMRAEGKEPGPGLVAARAALAKVSP